MNVHECYGKEVSHSKEVSLHLRFIVLYKSFALCEIKSQQIFLFRFVFEGV